MVPEIAVIIPCFNQGRFLLEALKSLSPFDDHNLEVIVVNDGSTDEDTIHILQEISAIGIRVFHKENGGVASARNFGIKSTDSPFFIPLDSDNLLYLPYLMEGLTWMKENPNCAVVYGDARIFGEREGTWCNHPLRKEEMVFENYIDNCALIRKSAWEKVGGYDTKVPVATREDYILWLDLLTAGFDFHYLPQFCFGYRYLENSKVRRYFKIPENRILIQEYILEKQQKLIQKLRVDGELPNPTADSILARHFLELAHSHLGFGSVLRGFLFLWKSFRFGGFRAELIKLAIFWPVRRLQKL